MRIAPLILFFLTVGIFACDTNQPRTVNKTSAESQKTFKDDATERLKTFYSAYIYEMSKLPEDSVRINKLIQEYCTASYATRLRELYEQGELDADPFIDLQDFDTGWVNTLTIQNKKSDEYSVCFMDPTFKEPHCVNVHVANIEGAWKINDVDRVE